MEMKYISSDKFVVNVVNSVNNFKVIEVDASLFGRGIFWLLTFMKVAAN